MDWDLSPAVWIGNNFGMCRHESGNTFWSLHRFINDEIQGAVIFSGSFCVSRGFKHCIISAFSSRKETPVRTSLLTKDDNTSQYGP